MQRPATVPATAPAVSNFTSLANGAAASWGVPATATYADVLKRSLSQPDVRSSSPTPSPGDSPPAPERRAQHHRHILGRPETALPFSQLSLGTTSPPWMASAWRTEACSVRGNVLRVEYPRGSGNFGSGGPEGGCTFKARPHTLPATDVTLHYRVRFASNFQWSKGGKLPGLFIGQGDASGGAHTPKAASARLMWVRDGQVVAYTYPPSGVRQSQQYLDQAKTKGGYGDEVFGAAKLRFREPGRWNDVVLRVKLNGFDEDGAPLQNGLLSLSVNGRAASVGGIVWRRYPALKIEFVAVTTFFGGAWTSPVDTYSEFHGFSVTT